MEEAVNTLAENIEGGYLSTFLILSIVFLVTLRKDIPIWINRLINIKNKLTVKSLEHHDLFNTCTRVKKEVSLMKFYTHGKYDITKSKMCNDFTRYKIKVCTEAFQNILKEDIEGMNPDAFKSYILDKQMEMHITYIESITKDWRSRGIKEDDIKYVIQLFETFRYDVVKAFEYRINSIFSSVSHKNNNRRLLAIFEMWAFGIDMLPRDMQTTFETLNGRFKEIKY
jgi:hypothetical protein